jgi:hypothetical protein
MHARDRASPQLPGYSILSINTHTTNYTGKCSCYEKLREIGILERFTCPQDIMHHGRGGNLASSNIRHRSE